MAPEISKTGFGLGTARPRRESAPKVDMQIDGGGGGGKGSGNEDGGWGPGGDDEDDDEDEEAKKRRRKGPYDIESLEAVLYERGMKLSELPRLVQLVYESGNLSTDILTRCLNMMSSPLFKNLLLTKNPIGQGLAQRVLADPNFLFKVAVEQFLSLSLAWSVEKKARGAQLRDESDFVVMDLLAVSLATFFATWVFAPTLPLAYLAGQAKGISLLLTSLPSHAFEVGLRGRTFTPLHRVAGVLLHTAQAATVAAGAAYTGDLANKAIADYRKNNNIPTKSGHIHSPCLANPGALSAASAIGLSFSPRYQLLSGLELLIAQHIRGTLRFPTVALRYANSRLGEWALVAGSRQLPLPKGLSLPAFPNRDIEPVFLVNGQQAQDLVKRGVPMFKGVSKNGLVWLSAFGAWFKQKAFSQSKDAETQKMDFTGGHEGEK
eukprot:CAMPEP_0184646142 /NCGR_PEP_ID=MMETSP0308-20130426/2775_1 /TAXON_ID=38269 /ORGANISM="Gloeochaete witrockiana, Strain SAG 46.84" /LENGTH=433 /DNA_ID=CAMNT_0027075849 /DNA_START=277 /DNA_END=1578 /DNA_ORIENTATION=-